MSNKKIIICKECGELKLHKAFGLCKSCDGKRYYKLNKKKIDEQHRVYDDTYRSEKKARSKIYYSIHKTEQVEYQQINAVRIAKYQKIYRKINHEEIKTQRRGYYNNHPVISFLGKSFLLLHHDRIPKGYVYHHTCYDYANPEANIVMLSRSSHVQGHALLRKLNIEIPHINIGEKNE